MNFIGQDLPSLGTNWAVETQFTAKFNGGWQNTGLAVWHGDNNFFRTSITHSLNAGNIYTEQSKDNPTRGRGARVQSGSNITIAAELHGAGHDPDARWRASTRLRDRHGAVPDRRAGERRVARLGELPRTRRGSAAT